MTAAIPNTYRFFVAPTAISGEQVCLTDTALIHQIGRVLRLRAGQRILLLDGLGTVYEVVLEEIERTHVSGHVERQKPATGEPPLHLTLCVALLRPERFAWVLQKGTELGVTTFVPVQFARSLPADHTSERKQERWHRIVREAAEQCCRGRIPDITPPHTVAEACTRIAHADLALLLSEAENRRDTPHTLRAALRQWHATSTQQHHIALLSGPEGGMTTEELTITKEHGIISVSLGPRILRAETAPLAAIAALWYECE